MAIIAPYDVLQGLMPSLITKARKRQIARLNGAKSSTASADLAFTKSRQYQDAADADATVRAHRAGLTNFEAWCIKHDLPSTPASPETVGAYLAAAGEGYAMPTLRRRVAPIARACRASGHPLDTKQPAIRETLRGIGRRHGGRSRRSAALATADIQKRCEARGTTLPGIRDRALFLLGFAGALRRCRAHLGEECQPLPAFGGGKRMAAPTWAPASTSPPRAIGSLHLS